MVRLVGACKWTFVLAIFSSGVMKATDPAAGAAFLRGVNDALSYTVSVQSIVVLGAFQCAAASFIASETNRLVQRICTLLVIIGAVTFDSLAGFTGSCGCFGSFEVPSAIKYAALGCGVIWTTWGRQGRAWPVWGTAAVVASAIYGCVMFVEHTRDAGLMNELELAKQLAKVGDQEATIMVMTASCAHCCEVIEKMGESAERPGLVVVLRRSSQRTVSDCIARAPKWVRTISIGRADWFRLVKGAPPTTYRVKRTRR